MRRTVARSRFEGPNKPVGGFVICRFVGRTSNDRQNEIPILTGNEGFNYLETMYQGLFVLSFSRVL